MATPTLRAPYGVSSPYTVDDPGVLKNPFGLGTGGGGGTGPQGPPGPSGHGSTTTTAAPSASGSNWIFTVGDTTAFVAFGTPVYCSDGTNSIYGTVVSVISTTQLTVAPDSTSGTVTSIANGSTFTFSGVAGATGPAGANASVYVGTTTNSGNAYTATPSPAIASYITGTLYTAQFNAANTGAVTLNISGLGAKNVYKNNAALTGAEITAGMTLALTYDGTQFQFTGDGGGSGGSSGISHGLDKDRPAPTSNAIYIATDSKLTYSSDGTKWYTSIGQDKVTVGGFNTSCYLISKYGGSNVGPTMSNPYTICMGWETISLPGTTEEIFISYFDGTNGWYLAGSGVNANKLSFWQGGINTSTETEFPGMTALTTGAHSVAISYDGSNLKLVLDGGSAVTVAVSGTYKPPASTQIYVGIYWTLGYAVTHSSIAYLHGYAAALSTADMQTLTATPSNYRPGAITTTPAYAWTAKSPWVANEQRVWGAQVDATGAGNLLCMGSLLFTEQ